MQTLDFIGVGAGPSGLSLAALAAKNKGFNYRVFDKSNNFGWHEGMLLPQSTLQTCYLKDLVTLVDPTSPYSFLNYLQSQGRIYQFITTGFLRVSRREYNDYFIWAFDNIPAVESGCCVNSVEYKDKFLHVETSRGLFRTKKIILSVGKEAYIPACCNGHIGGKVFHSKYYTFSKADFSGKRIVVIGGGQSGAEIVDDLLGNQSVDIKSVTWVSSRANFLPMDESPFTNELFTPAYSRYFSQLDPSKRNELLADQKLSSVGISEHLLEKIYRNAYLARFVDKRNIDIHFLPACRLVDVEVSQEEHVLTVHNDLNNRRELITADYVILCTGYRWRLPDFLSRLASYFVLDNNDYVLDKNYKMVAPDLAGCSVYAQNFSASTYGIADPNLSLVAYRSATIINSIAGKDIYENIGGEMFFSWREAVSMPVDVL